MYNLTMIVADSNKASAQAMFADRGYTKTTFNIELTDGTDTFWSQQHKQNDISTALLNSDLLHYVSCADFFFDAIEEAGLQKVNPEIEA